MTEKKLLHVAIIPDGNRRWARAKGLNAWKGHEQSAQNFRRIIEWCAKEPSIGTLTIWCFSTENWKRDTKEVEKLMKMLEQYLIDEAHTFHESKIRLVHSGRSDRFTPELKTLLSTLQKETAHYEAFTLNLAIDYGGKDELLRAMRKLTEASDITEESFRTLLDQPTVQDIDLVIRTSGEQRTSNFFLWQSAYAEWMFHQKFFPDFLVKDLQECVQDFLKRTRRFGS